MTPREAAAPRLFKLGEYIPPAPNGIGGEIVCLRNLSATRQQVYFRHGNGGLASMTVEIEGGFVTALCGPVAAGDARELAVLILAGRAVRLPIERQLNILAGALLAAGETEGESS